MRLRIFDALYNLSVDLTRLNYTFVVWIPKKSDSLSVADYRPVSLENGVIKIISKVLSLRLRPFLGSLVLDFQTIFVKDKMIFESFITAAEVIAFSKKN